MADIDQKVQISIEADASHFRREIEKIRRDIATISGQGTRLTTASSATKRAVTGRSDKRLREATLRFESKINRVYKERDRLLKRMGHTMAQNERISRKTGGGRGKTLASTVGSAIGVPGGFKGGLKAFGIAGAGMVAGAVKSALMQAYGTYMQVGQAKGRLVGMGIDPGRYAAGESRAASRFGVGPTQFAQTARAVTSRVGGGGASATMRAIQMQRATGMDAGAAATLLGTMAQAGQGFGGKTGTKGLRELETVMAAAFSSGLERARVPEFLQGVNTLVRRQGMVSAGDVSSRGAAMLLTQLGQSGLTGFRGERGARVAANLDETIRRGGAGAGAAGKSFMLRAFGFGAGGGASYVEALRRMEKGVSDPTNVKSMLEQVRKEYGTGEAGQLALSKLSGGSVSLSQAQGLFSMLNKGGLSAKNIKEVMSAGVKKTLSERALESMNTTFGEVASHTANIEEILAITGEKIAPDIMRIQTVLLEHLPAIASGVAAVAEVASMTAEAMAPVVTNPFGMGIGAVLQQLSGGPGGRDPVAASPAFGASAADPVGGRTHKGRQVGPPTPTETGFLQLFTRVISGQNTNIEQQTQALRDLNQDRGASDPSGTRK